MLSIYDNCDQSLCLEPVITVKQNKTKKEKRTFFDHVKTSRPQTELVKQIYKPNILLTTFED